MAKAACIVLILCFFAFLGEVHSKFTIVDKQKDAHNLNQMGNAGGAMIGKPIKLHLDRVYSVSANSFLQSQADNMEGEAKHSEKAQSLTQDCPSCGCSGSSSDDNDADEIEKSERRMKKALEKKEERDTRKELLKESKDKLAKTNDEMNDEHDKDEIKKDTEEKLAKIKKSSKSTKKKIKQEKIKEEIKEQHEKIIKATEASVKETKAIAKERKVKAILEEGEQKAEKTKKNSEDKIKDAEKKVEAASTKVKAAETSAPAPAAAPAASSSAPASEPKIEKASEPKADNVITITRPGAKAQEPSEDEEKDGAQINKEEAEKEQTEKNSVNEHIKSESDKEDKAAKKEEKKLVQKKADKKALKKALKKDPYKQSVDILNGAPFTNIRAGGDTGSIKSTLGDAKTTDDGQKKYTQKQFDVAVRMASHDSAELAVSKLKQTQAVDKAEDHAFKKEIKAAEKGTKAVMPSSTKAVKSAIKEAVIKVSGNKKIADPKLSEEFDKEAHKHSGPLYHAIQGIVDDPYGNGLNAETTAGIAVAKQLLDGSSAAIENGMKDLSMTSRHLPPGITPSGFLDDESDD